MRRRRRGLLFWLTAGALCAGFAVLLVGVVRSLRTPIGGGPAQLISVEPGETVTEVATTLRDRGLIANANALVLAAYLTGKWRCIQAGRHELDPEMSALDMLDALCRGSRTTWGWLTIPEGHNLVQIAAKLQEERLGSRSQFLAAARAPDRFQTAFPLPGSSLEGYLFPDTYRVDSGETEEDVIGQMLRRFDRVVWKGLFHETAEYEGRSLHDILTLASLVEWEAQQDEERRTIAGVLVNRLERGQRLECDATVQYALGDDRKSRLSYDDLSIENEYNTYLREGLPPGPICSPGESSIRAAMDPAEVPYLYYVARADGSHVFSTTFSQHQAAIARVRRER
jgi:UPF0755 protein